MIMEEIRDKQKRLLLISRYLNGETTVEEEKALLLFYQTTSEDLDPDEEDVRQLLFATSLLSGSGAETDGATTTDNAAEEEFDRIVAAASGRRKKSIWRWTAVAVAAATITAVALVNRPTDKVEDTLPPPIAANTTPPTETKSQIAAKTPSASPKVEAPKPAKAVARRKKHKQAAKKELPSSPEISVDDVCELATTVFTGAESLTATEEKGNLIITVAYNKGEVSNFRLVSNEGGAQTFVAF